MIQSSFLFANITTLEYRKWQKWLLAWTYALYLPICTRFIKLYQTGIKILFTLQQDVCMQALIYGARLQLNVGGRLPKKSFSALLQCLVKKLISFWKDTLEKEDFNLSTAVSMKLNHSDIFSFPNKLKFDGTKHNLHKAFHWAKNYQ